MKNIATLLRPKQYIKNIIIFLPLFFSSQITDIQLLYNAVVAFAAFSLCVSGIYIFNDIQDADYDRKHPIKKSRPIASGAVSVKTAIIFMCVMLLAGFALMFFLSLQATLYMAFYVLLNIAYSLYLKHIAILDVSVIGVGFVIRLLVGSVVTSTSLSMWIVIMIFLLALFIALAKRRDDVLVHMKTGIATRKVIDGYNLAFIDSAMAILSSVIIVSYLLYTTSAEIIARLGNEDIYLTTFFVILGVLRYLQITFVMKLSGDPVSIFLNDRFLIFSMLGWVLAFVAILY
ncbi:MAG: UbiA prenyltransferase family protein [Gammaproteobacteria bacterium]